MEVTNLGFPVAGPLARRLLSASRWKSTGREALAEYVVYKEMPKDAKIAWLETVVQKGCDLAKSKRDKKAYDAWMPVAKTNGVVWLLLFDGRGNDYFW